MRRVECLFFFLSFGLPSMGQALISTIDMEVTSTKDFGKVLSIKVVVINNSREDLYIDRFPYPLQIERMDSATRKFENYYTEWFSNMIHDSTADEISKKIGVVIVQPDEITDALYAKALLERNSSVKDSVALKAWTEYQVGQLKTIKSKGNIEYRYNVNSLRFGYYRFALRYSNVGKNAKGPLPGSKTFQLPQTLNSYKRWKGSITSDAIYLTVR
jgi:hypothetical protein